MLILSNIVVKAVRHSCFLIPLAACCCNVFAGSVYAQVVPQSPLVWLRADSNVVVSGDTVLSWKDVSGNGNDAKPVIPSIAPLLVLDTNNRQSIRFSGAQWLACPNIFPIHQDYTIIIVTPKVNYGAGVNLVSGSSGHALVVLNTARPAIFQSGFFATSRAAVTTTTPFICAATYQTATKLGTVNVNGVNVGSGASATDNSDNTLEIGAFAGGNFMNGDISEVLIYARALSASELWSVEQYLAQKYLIPVVHQLPPQTAPIVVLSGDNGVTLSSDTVLSWRDTLPNGATAIPKLPADRPIFNPNAINKHSSLTFNGTNVLYLPNIFPIFSDYTIVVVMKCSNLGLLNNIASGSTTHAFFLDESPYLQLYNAGVFATSIIPITQSSWAILSGTYTAASLKGSMYVNSQYAGSGTAALDNNDSTLEIGEFASAAGFAGDIAEVLVYNRALSSAERDSVEQSLGSKYGIGLYAVRPSFPFTQFPAPLQFIARNAQDSGYVPISGTVTYPNFDSVRVDEFRDDGYWRSYSEKLQYNDLNAPFSISPAIYARAVEYGFKVYLVRNGIDSLIGSADSIICGDAYLITGQSNSTPGNAAVTYTNEFCRSFGSQDGLAVYDTADTSWGLSTASSTTFAGHLHVGEWGLYLQQDLLERYGIPTCVICGGVGGTTIEQNEPTLNHQDLTSIYGRTLYRAVKAGLADKFKALYWYQGESNSIVNYDSNFHLLYHSWRTDYPSLQKLYVMQIHPGCAEDPSHGMLRDLERRFPDSLADIEAVSPDACPGHDGCHYLPEGYSQLAVQLFHLLARDFYGSDDSLDIDSPDLDYAAYTSSSHNEIALVFRKPDPLIWEPQLGTERLEDAILLDSISGNVLSGSASGNRILLQLASPSSAKLITYVPYAYYAGTSTVYEGPWITNSRNVAALTFNDVPILDSLRSAGVSISDVQKSQLAVLGVSTSDRDVVEISLRSQEAALLSVTLYDQLGRPLFQNAHWVPSGDHILQVPSVHLASGTYFCVLKEENATASTAINITR